MVGLGGNGNFNVRRTAVLALLVLAAPMVQAAVPAIPPLAATATDTPASCLADPGTAACSAAILEQTLAWTESVPVQELQRYAVVRAKELGGARTPAPDAIPGYDQLGPDLQRGAWRAWLVRTAHDALLAPYGSLPFDQPASDPEAPPAEPTGARGLNTQWSLDPAGAPLAVVPADGDAYLLVTQLGVLRFPNADAPPQWFFQAGGVVFQAESADANADGVPDIVLGVMSYLYFERPESILVVDGATGAILWSGMAGESTLWTWTLTDADGDQVLDILGVDLTSSVVALKLDGTEIFRQVVQDLPSAGDGAVVAYAFLFYDPLSAVTFADVTGDGVKDVLVSNGYTAYAYAIGVVVVGLVVTEVGLMSGYDGSNGELVWQAAPEPGGAFDAMPLLSQGDLTGDGREDPLVLVLDFTYVLAYAFPVVFGYVYSFSVGITALDGALGTPLFRDEYRLLYVSEAPTPILLGSIDYWPLAVTNLDGEGAAEIVALAEGNDGLVVQGRVPGPAPLGPSDISYSREVTAPAYDDLGVFPTLRNLNGDDQLDLLLLIVGVEGEEAAATMSSTIVTVVGETAATRFTPGVVFAYDVDPVHARSFAWRAEDARWVQITDEGKVVGNGYRVLPYASPLLNHDQNGDGRVDVLMPALGSLLWLDGRTGGLLGEITRPLTRGVLDAIVEQGQIRLAEIDWGTGDLFLVDPTTGADLWKVAGDDAGYTYGRWIEDVTGDGRLDLVMDRLGDEGFEGVAIEMPAGSTVWTIDTGSRFLRVEDALTTRPGKEILAQNYGEEEATVELYGTESNEPRWSYAGEDGASLSDARDGLVLVHSDDSLRALNAADGAVLSAWTVPEDAWINDERLVQVNPDASPDAVIVYDLEDSTFVHVHNMAAGVDIATFQVADPLSIDVGGWDYEISAFLAEEPRAGDWNADGAADLVIIEQLIPTVRSGKDGAVLAVVPTRGDVDFVHDVTGDGIPDLGVNVYGARWAVYTRDATQGSLPNENGPRLVTNPPAPGDAQAKDEDDSKGSNGLPGFEAAMLIAGLVGVALLRRRRSA